VELVNCAAIQASASERQIHRLVTRSARPRSRALWRARRGMPPERPAAADAGGRSLGTLLTSRCVGRSGLQQSPTRRMSAAPSRRSPAPAAPYDDVGAPRRSSATLGPSQRSALSSWLHVYQRVEGCRSSAQPIRALRARVLFRCHRVGPWARCSRWIWYPSSPVATARRPTLTPQRDGQRAG
jgi:hypothetical protein